jgi:cytochrome c biogenesis protein CcmG/thiol:disulfide interchange protein DsbE
MLVALLVDVLGHVRCLLLAARDSTYPGRLIPTLWNVAPRAWSAPLAALAVAGALAGCGSGDAPSQPAQPAGRLSGESGRLVGGGTAAFQRQLGLLKGTPVVVNQWASWCGPCRFEFPFFASLARGYKGRVAFLGVDSQDSRDGAQRFLREHPVPYPSFYDPDVSIARAFRGGAAWPTTAYYAASGKREYTHAGGYSSRSKLDADIRRYALGAG